MELCADYLGMFMYHNFISRRRIPTVSTYVSSGSESGRFFSLASRARLKSDLERTESYQPREYLVAIFRFSVEEASLKKGENALLASSKKHRTKNL